MKEYNCRNCNNKLEISITTAEADILNDHTDSVVRCVDLGRLSDDTQERLATLIQIIKRLTGADK